MKRPLRNCLFEPIPQLFEAATLLHKAGMAHAAGDTSTARTLIAQTDANASHGHSPIFDWSETLFYGKKGEVKSSPKNIEKHVAFQALDLDWEHIVPRSLGGMNTLSNLIVACAPCNTGKGHYTLLEMSLNDPRERPPTVPIGFEDWDGLTCVLKKL